MGVGDNGNSARCHSLTLWRVEAQGGRSIGWVEFSSTAVPDRWTRHWSESPTRKVLRVGGPPERWLSAAEVDAATRRVVGALVAAGVQHGDRVVWQSDVTPASVLCALGVLRAGGVLVPVSAAQSARERQVVLADVNPALVVAPGFPNGVTEGVRCLDAETLLTQSSVVGEPLEGVDLESLAVIIYTSGTTGRPKGAMLSHRALSAGLGALETAWELNAEDILVTALPLFHVHGLLVALCGGLAAGGGVDLHARFDVSPFLAATTEPSSTLAYCVPTMLHRMAQSGDLDKLKGLRLLVSGSAPLSVELFDEIRERSGHTILERYGMTETLLTFSNPLHGERRAGTVGLPLPGVRARLPQGADEGELVVSGPSLFSGYWNRPEATSEVMRDGWMATGDVVRVDSAGYTVICGRKKELIISGGFNVYPTEVEDMLRGREGIVDAAVVGRPSAEWGEEVVAFVVTATGGDVNADRLRVELNAEMSSYKIPRTFIVVDELPRNALGKLQRHLL